MPITPQQSNHLKSIAILMMLFLHLFNREWQGSFTPLIFIGAHPLSYYISLFSDACLPIFAFVSGYGLYYKYRQNKISFKNENPRRLKKLYVNYWIVLLLFPVILGLITGKEGYPGTLVKFVLNASGFDTTYNGSWWFFTSYILFVLTSSYWFRLLDKVNLYIYVAVLLFAYLVAFFLKYDHSDLENDLLRWFREQLVSYFFTLFQFMLGAFAMKYRWNEMAAAISRYIKHVNFTAGLVFILITVLHGFIPNSVIAPFTALVFIFTFLQMKLPTYVNKGLDFFSPHSTNLWLTHMFFYLIFFPTFIYSFEYVPLIFIALVLLCIMSSYIINFLFKKIIA